MKNLKYLFTDRATLGAIIFGFALFILPMVLILAEGLRCATIK